MFILCLELWLVNHTLINENSELKVFKNIKIIGEISNNLPKDQKDFLIIW